jgi:endonuclease III
MPSSTISRFFQPRSQNEKDTNTNNDSNTKKRPRIHAKKSEVEPQEVILIDSDDDDTNDEKSVLENRVIVIDSDDDDINDEQSVLGNRNDTLVGKHQVMNKSVALDPRSTLQQEGSVMDTVSNDSGQDTVKASLTLGPTTSATDETIFPETEMNQQEKREETMSSTDETLVPETERNQQEKLKEIESSEAPDPLASSSSLPATATTTTKASNPFAMFAACSSTSASTQASLSHASTFKNVQWRTHQPPNKKVTKPSLSSSTQTCAATTETSTKPKSKAKAKTEWIKMRDLPAEEQARVVEKWHSLLHVLIDKDAVTTTSRTAVHVKDDSSSTNCTTGTATSPTAAATTPCLEDRRFQIVVAARLHAQCQEAAVRKALQALQQVCQGHLSVEQIAAAKPDDLAAAMTNLQYYNVKAKHLVQSAQQIQSLFGGKVPEDETQLRKLIGIGPVMGDILAFVNTRAMHLSRTAPVSVSASALDGSTHGHEDESSQLKLLG